ncbi:hypothetical protein F5877DRAFT_89495 [Lentinula edodes]|nr:hypothetical protein F5877DRAFT_89495 [Lentinula edodes]
MDNMNKSLDDIIKSRPRTHRRSSGRNARAQVLGKTPAAAAPAARQRIKVAKATPALPATAQQPADKIIVSNLPQDVNEQQVKELFHTTVGPLREVTLHYDSAGRSKGVAAVLFQRKGDGTKAFQQYNNRLIDGKRPMKIEIVVDPTRAAPGPSLAARVAPATVAAQPNGAHNANATRGGARRGRGRGGRTRKNERPNKSAADLDAEMEDYTSTTAPAATTAAA